jgi:predicted CXXCH cytochrome family protein
MSRRKKKPQSKPTGTSAPADEQKLNFWERALGVWLALFCLLLMGLLAWFIKQRQPAQPPPKNPETVPGKLTLEPEAQAFAQYAGSESCRQCHVAEFAKWQGSHHGLAERKVEMKLDGVAFEPPKEIKTGTLTSEAHLVDGKLALTTAGLKSKDQTFIPDREIGVDPVRQFLIGAPGGRWQATELAWDPHQQDWFDVYGNEDRQPGEWGHWTGRGMTWNQMCASCHNTRVRKNYEVKDDVYHTTMAEMTVGCEACHGPMKAHADWQRDYAGKGTSAQSSAHSAQSLSKTGDPTIKRMTRDQMLDTCGMCHARRVELTGDFVPGDQFFDHFALSIPDESDLFYPDGQVRDEDYEYTSFLGSKMHAAGVRCMDCHEPHTSKNPVEGNALCMRCHSSPAPVVPGVAVAPQIADPAHSFHKAGTTRCVDCHMPETTYMQRHARRDHGFTIPDPLLTKEHGIPNSCNRCHADQNADWAIDQCNKWYGDKMNRPTRVRAQWVAQARAGASGAHSNLLKMLAEEKSPLWRAVAANLLRASIHEKGVLEALQGASKDASPLVRAMAVRSIGANLPPTEAPGSAGSASTSGLQEMLGDLSRSVRIDAAWGLRRTIDPESRAGSELLHYLNLNRDQPTGLTQWATYLADRGDNPGALAAFKEAVDWDQGSGPLHSNYAIALSMAGKPDEAVKQLAEAVKISPREAALRYTYALALNEVNRAQEARAQLEQAVQLDPQFARAWYNLGLARNAANEPQPALEALARAEALDPHSPEAPYAAATILARLQRGREAAEAAKRALKIDPSYRDAAELLQSLGGG